jgi:hypothetical protein
MLGKYYDAGRSVVMKAFLECNQSAALKKHHYTGKEK